MEQNQTELFSGELFQTNNIPRKKLLPVWMKVFAWIFLVFGALVPVVMVMGVMGYRSQLSLYGLNANEALSPTGIIIAGLFIIKTITAFGLLKEQDWAIKIGIADAIIGIGVCSFVMIYPLFVAGFQFFFRLELIALIPYLLRLLKIKAQWEDFGKERL